MSGRDAFERTALPGMNSIWREVLQCLDAGTADKIPRIALDTTTRCFAVDVRAIHGPGPGSEPATPGFWCAGEPWSRATRQSNVSCIQPLSIWLFRIRSPAWPSSPAKPNSMFRELGGLRFPLWTHRSSEDRGCGPPARLGSRILGLGSDPPG